MVLVLAVRLLEDLDNCIVYAEKDFKKHLYKWFHVIFCVLRLIRRKITKIWKLKKTKKFYKLVTTLIMRNILIISAIIKNLHFFSFLQNHGKRFKL